MMMDGERMIRMQAGVDGGSARAMQWKCCWWIISNTERCRTCMKAVMMWMWGGILLRGVGCVLGLQCSWMWKCCG